MDGPYAAVLMQGLHPRPGAKNLEPCSRSQCFRTREDTEGPALGYPVNCAPTMLSSR